MTSAALCYHNRNKVLVYVFLREIERRRRELRVLIAALRSRLNSGVKFAEPPSLQGQYNIARDSHGTPQTRLLVLVLHHWSSSPDISAAWTTDDLDPISEFRRLPTRRNPPSIPLQSHARLVRIMLLAKKQIAYLTPLLLRRHSDT